MIGNLMKKARRLVKDGCVAKIDENLYQVPSSTQKNKVYIIKNFECECKGFIDNGICSHSEATRLLEKELAKL